MYFTNNDIDEIIDYSSRIVSEIGIKVLREDIAEILIKKGFRQKNNRILIEKNKFLEKLKSYPKPEYEPPKPFLTCSVSAYPHTYQNIEGAYEGITDESNIKMSQLVTMVQKDYPFLYLCAPGHPSDIPPILQFYFQTVNTIKNCPDSEGAEPMNTKIAPYVFEAAEIAGRPRKSAAVYVVSPLTMAGESLDIVIENKHRFEAVFVTCMPVLGANTPLNINAAYAQSTAETLGSAILIEEATGIKTDFFPQIFPMDYRTVTMAFGTPEQLLTEWMNNEVNAALRGGQVQIRSTDFHVMAPAAGTQALTEKAMLAAAGAMRGARHFHTIGTLAMDEIFSPVQFLMDLDMLGSIQKIIRGLPCDKFEGDIIETVRSGIEDSYISSDLTLDNMGSYVYYPRLMTRASFNAIRGGIRGDMLENAKMLAADYLRRPPVWRIDSERERALDKLTEKMKRNINI